jgi:hypothetical protein
MSISPSAHHHPHMAYQIAAQLSSDQQHVLVQAHLRCADHGVLRPVTVTEQSIAQMLARLGLLIAVPDAPGVYAISSLGVQVVGALTVQRWHR